MARTAPKAIRYLYSVYGRCEGGFVGIGIGGGLGPIRVGTHVSDDEIAGCLAWFIGIAAVVLAIFWPYLLGSWIASQLGAPNPSTARNVTGWAFEAAYVVGALWVWVALTDRNDRATQVARTAAQAASVRAEIQTAAEIVKMAGTLLHRLAEDPLGTSDPRIPARENLLFTLSGVQLIEPRVAQRGGPRIPTAVAEGELVLSDRTVRFRSEERQVEWSVAKMHTQYEGPDRITWAVTNRKTVTGVGGSPLVFTLVKGLLTWAGELPNRPDAARHFFEETLTQSATRVKTLQAELAQLQGN